MSAGRVFVCQMSVGWVLRFRPTIAANDSQLTADGPYMNNLRENCISNIGNFSQRTTTGHLLLGAVIASFYLHRRTVAAFVEIFFFQLGEYKRI